MKVHRLYNWIIGRVLMCIILPVDSAADSNLLSENSLICEMLENNLSTDTNMIQTYLYTQAHTVI